MVQVHAGVDGLEGGIDGIALLVAPNDIVAHVEGDDLLEVEHVLDDDNAAACFGKLLLVGVLFLLGIVQFGDANAYAKLTAALVALEHQRRASSIFCFIKDDIMVALGTPDSLHETML